MAASYGLRVGPRTTSSEKPGPSIWQLRPPFLWRLKFRPCRDPPDVNTNEGVVWFHGYIFLVKVSGFEPKWSIWKTTHPEPTAESPT